MYFFHPIQQSAPHIYHSALTLSPKSFFRSMTVKERTRITGIYQHPRTWGLVVRTIASSSKCTTAFGHRIAIARDDGTVAIYDSVTGVLKSSLSPANPVQAMRGSPDGSILFCTHQRPSVTSWDLQTGGLIHTFIPESNVEDIAVSLKGRYLACRFPDGTVKIWEVATRLECATIANGFLETHLCWLEPEDQLAVTIGPSVRIWNVVSAKVLRRFTLQGPTIYGVIYSQRLDQLLIVTGSAAGNIVNIIDPLQCVPSTSHEIKRRITCFTFSQTTNQLVCGTKTKELGLFDFSTQSWTNLKYADEVTFISSLPNGMVVANFAGSGVQVLSLDHGYSLSLQSTTPPLAMHTKFDEDRILAALSTSGDRIVLQEPATMSELLTIPARGIYVITPLRTNLLCASLHNRTAVYRFGESDREYLQLWEFHGENPRWTVEIGKPPSACEISLYGGRIVTFHKLGSQTRVCVWDAWRGRLEAQLRVDFIHPTDITFHSETEFYSHHHSFDVRFVVSPPESANPLRGASRTYRDVSSSESATLSHSITHRGQPSPPTGCPQKRCYDVDNTCEWVVSGSKRICWIPQGYIRSAQPNYWWTGHLLVMAGQDGTFRVLTFRE